MPLKDAIESVIQNLRQGRFPNEQSISQGIVLRLLQELGWNTWDTTIVWPEYRTSEGRADFALCHPATQPAVFIEVKPPGKAEDSVRQALDYAFHSGGVPFVVLTDGKTWSFYLTMEKGTYEERRVYKLDLFERTTEEIADRLTEYLQHGRVASGEALESARSQYRNRNRRSLAQQTIPTAWLELIATEEPLLVETVQDAVESKCGIRPEAADVIGFLRQLGAISASTPSIPLPRQAIPVVPISRPVQRSRAGTIRLLGEDIPVRNAIEATVLILRRLAQRDSSFLPRCAAHPDNAGRKRTYIARSSEEMFPDRQDLRELHEPIADGWLLNSNVSNQIKKKVLEMACQVAGLKFGNDVQVDF